MGQRLDPFAETESQKQQTVFVHVVYIIIHKEGKFSALIKSNLMYQRCATAKN